MGDRSKIEWTDATWNPVIGCTRVSRGCGGPGDQGGCYAEAMAARFSKPGQWGHGLAEMRGGKPRWTGVVRALVGPTLTRPLRWKQPRHIFVNSTSDLFHEALPDEAIDRIFAVMALCPQHTLQVLTKRPERMKAYVADLYSGKRSVARAARELPGWANEIEADEQGDQVLNRLLENPLPNVWLGTSCEDQDTANERIPHLLATPAAVRFLSCEPLLGPINLDNAIHVMAGECWNYLTGWCGENVGADEDGRAMFLGPGDEHLGYDGPPKGPGINWVICGGESGKNARPMHPDWARSLRDQCAAASVPFFFKQWGEWSPYGGDEDHAETTFVDRSTGDEIAEHDCAARDEDLVYRLGKKNAGRNLDGREWNEMPRAA